MFRAGLRFLVIGPALLIASWLVGNSALMANGIDNSVDGIYMTSSGWLGKRWSRSPDHDKYCKRRGQMRMVSALIAIPFIAIGIWIDYGRNQADLAQMVVSLVAAAIVIPVAIIGRGEIHDDHDKHHGGNILHLTIDILAAATAAVSSIVAFVTGVAGWNLAGAIFVLLLAIWHGSSEAREAYSDFRHPESEHDHDHEPPELHALHAKAP